MSQDNILDLRAVRDAAEAACARLAALPCWEQAAIQIVSAKASSEETQAALKVLAKRMASAAMTEASDLVKRDRG